MPKTMPWIRLYVEALDDPKVGTLPSHLKWPWIEYLLVNEKNNGTLPSLAQMAFMLRRSETVIKTELDALVAAGLIDLAADGTMIPHNWGGRQFRADPTNAQRQQRFKAKRKKAQPPVTVNGASPVTVEVTEPVTHEVTVEVTDPSNGPQTTEADSEPEAEAARSIPELSTATAVEVQNRGEDCAAEAGAAFGAPRKRPKRLSADWMPTPKNLADALRWGLAQEHHTAVTEDFKAWAATSPNAVKLDWDLCWGTWIRRVVREGTYTRPGPRPASGTVVPYKPRPAVRVAYDVVARSDAQWAKHLLDYSNCRVWDKSVLGPEPFDPGCAAPQRLFRAAGLRPPGGPMVNFGNGAQPWTAEAPASRPPPIPVEDTL